MSKKFLHVGCVTHDKNFPGLNYNQILDCYCSDPTANEHNIEWLFFPETSPLAKTAVATTTHIAYMVDDLKPLSPARISLSNRSKSLLDSKLRSSGKTALWLKTVRQAETINKNN